MKNFPFLLLIFLITSCSPEAVDSPGETPEKPGESENLAPSKPELVSPENDLFCSEPNLIFEWNNSIDPEGDPVTYQLQISANSDFSDIYYSANSSSVTKDVELEKGKIYYWRVSAKDSKGMSSGFSQVRSLYTEAIPSSNTLPSFPELISPQQGAVIESDSVTLKWSATDADGDELVYDLYFGESSIPQLLKPDHTTGSYNIENLVKGTKYFWKVVVKDSKRGSAHGEAWSFTVK